MNRLQLSFFGTFAVRLGDQRLNDLSTDKVRALLAYLVLESSRDHPRRHLAALLWPEVSDKQARQSLRDALYRLRQSLDRLGANVEPPLRVSEQLLVVSHQTVQLQTSSPLLDTAVDVAYFRNHLAAVEEHSHVNLAECDQCLAALEEAATLYQGELLAAFGLADAPEFEEWLLLQREMLHQQALLAFGHLADIHTERGSYEKAAGYATKLLSLDPYRETSHRLVMRLLALRGLPDQALAQFANCRQLMMEEFGAEPDAETLALAEKIQRGELQGGKATKWQRGELPPPNLPQSGGGTVSSFSNTLPPSQTGAGWGGASQHDWREMPSGAPFFGRTGEVAQLETWLVNERCRLVSILAIGGMGKTSLAAQVVPTIAEYFDLVIWRSLLNAPPLAELLDTILPVLSNQQIGSLPDGLGPRLQLLFSYLHEQRVLLILDNLESILQADAAGQYRVGYEAYDQLLQGVATQQHQGQLLFTSREQPAKIKQLERDTPQVRSLQLGGLDPGASEQLLESRGLSGDSHDEAALIERYSGNPLALKLVADTVQDLFLGDVQEFLAEDSLIFDDVRHVLDQQFERATQLEQEILLWLAVERKPMSVADIRAHLLYQPPQRHLVEALHHLQRRSLIERGEAGFGLQNVIIEYLTALFIEQAYTEVLAEKLDIFNRHALLLARSVEYIRQSQARLLVLPLGKQLCSSLGSKAALLAKIKGLLERLRSDPKGASGYAAGNFLNLLLTLEMDVQGCDFSALRVRQAFLQGARLRGVRFDGAELSDSVFNDAFGIVQALALHPDGDILAIASLNEGVRLWRMDDWQLQAVLSNDGIRVASIAFSPDGSTIVGASDDNTIRIWQTESGKLIHSLVGHSDALWSVAIAPDGKHIASASDDNTVRLWNSQTGQAVATIAQHEGVPKAVAFSPDSRTLASTGRDDTLRLWGIDIEQEQAVMQSPTELSTALAFSPNGCTIATGDNDGKIVLWDVETAQMRQTLRGHAGWINGLAFAPTGRSLVSTCNDQTARIWDVQSGETTQILPHTSWVWDVAFAADGSRVVTSCNNLVAVWNAQTGHLQNTLNGHSGHAKSLMFSSDGRMLVAASADGAVHHWRADLPVPQYLPNAGKGTWIDFVALHPDAQSVASSSPDKKATLIWDAHAGHPLRIMQEHTGRSQAGAFSADGQRLVTVTGDRTLLLWDTQSGQLLHRHHIAGENQFVYQIASSSDASMVAVAGADHFAYVWVPQKQHTIRLAGHSRSVYSVAFHPDGQMLATCSSDRTVCLWDLSSIPSDMQEANRPQHVVEGHVTWVWSVTFSPDGTLLASGSEDGTIILWELPSATVRHTLKAHTGWISAFAFTPDGQTVASSGGDETIKFWDVQTGACLHTLHVPGPYQGMNITGITGITEAQKASLKALGAVEE